MYNFELSMAAIEDYVSGKPGSYIKNGDNNRAGARYEQEDETTGVKFNVDIRLCNTPDTVIYEMYSGIRILSEEYLPTASKYCQAINTEFGSVNVHNDYSEIKYHAETSCIDNPITAKTLEVMEQEGLKALSIHRDNMLAIADGRFMDINPVKESKKTKGIVYDENKEATIENIRDYLGDAGHNEVGENTYEKGITRFFSQVLTNDEFCNLEFYFTRNGFMTIKGWCGENAMLVPKPFQYMVAEYLNRENAKHKYGSLFVGDDKQGVYGEISTSIIDGPVGKKTIEFMEMVLLNILIESKTTVRKLSAGLLPKIEEDDDHKLEEMMRKFDALKGLDGRIPKLPGLGDLLRRNAAIEQANPFGNIENGMDGSFITSANEDYPDEISMDEYAEKPFEFDESDDDLNDDGGE